MKRAGILCLASAILLTGCDDGRDAFDRYGYSGVPGLSPEWTWRRQWASGRTKPARAEQLLGTSKAPRSAPKEARVARPPPPPASPEPAPAPGAAPVSSAPPSPPEPPPKSSPGAAVAAPAQPRPPAPPALSDTKGQGRAGPYRGAKERTASGEIWSPDFYTAAHADLPFGTRLRVSGRGKSVEVRINDRPSAEAVKRGLVLELTPRSAREIGLPTGGDVTFEAAP